MHLNGIIQLAIYIIFLLLLVKPYGWIIYQIYESRSGAICRIMCSVENWIFRLCRISPTEEMNWKTYLRAMLIFNLVGFFAIYAIQRLQFYLPLNPQSFSGVTPDLAFNTATSFVTNTDWEAYSGENTLSYLTQMMGMTVQNFLSAATGMALLMAVIRGITRHNTEDLGNFWVDVYRGTVCILLPLSFILSLILVSQGVIQNFKPYQTVSLLQPFHVVDHQSASPSGSENASTLISTQTIPMGPVASQIAIKQLGTNGGGFFGVNSAHPFENPTPISNFIELIAILLIPASLCFTYGLMVGDKRQGWAILLAILLIFLPFVGSALFAEEQKQPALISLGIDYTGNMEGKEVRHGVATSALWAAATTASSNGSVNAMHDSLTPVGQLTPIMLMHFGEVVFGGVGTGLYGMLMLVIITVFVAGLMVGRTPEYLGKKIEPFEMKMAVISVLIMPLLAILCTAVCVVVPDCLSAISNPDAHGFTEILYAWTSMANNNGSSMAGLKANTPFYTIIGGVVMLLSRYWIAIPTLAIAGSLAKKKKIPVTKGTLQTHTFLFIVLLMSVTIVLRLLSFLPAFAIGPVIEQLMWR